MKVLLSLLVSAAVCSAETAVPAADVVAKTPEPSAERLKPEDATLVVGSPVTTDVFSKLDWVQGTGPKAWEPGKVYLFECWATWCGPCVAAIPHVNELHKKYAEKGLIVSGINVWEDGKDKVVTFVKNKGDGMSYNVAYTGKGGAFETEWLNPAGVTGIPHAFVVKDGKVVLKTHPMELTDEVIEGFLAGGDAQAKALESINAKKAAQEKVGALVREFGVAKTAKDVDAMAKALAALKEADPDASYFPMMNFDLLIAKKDWAGAESAIDALPDQNRLMVLFNAIRTLMTLDDAPASLIKKVANSLAPDFETKGGAMENQMLAAMLWKAGEKESALKSAKLAAEKAANPNPNARMVLPAGPFVRYVEQMEKGTPPTTEEFSGWVREEMQKAAHPAPKAAE